MEVEYSSDESLAWTNCSSDSESSTDVTSNMKLNNCNSESEYKIDTHDSEGKKHKKKAKKRKRDEELCESDDSRRAKKKFIKTEPVSDEDESKTEDNIAQSDSFVNLRIKQENSLEPDEIKSKKKKKHEKSLNESELLNGTDDNHLNNTLDVSPIEDNIKKKKKKKKSKHSDSEQEREKTKKSNSYNSENFEDNENEHSDEIVTDKKIRLMSSTCIDNDFNKTNVDDSIVNNISVIPSKVSKKTTRTSDRLIFEDDENLDKLENEYESNNNVSYSRDVKKFLKSNPTLSPLKLFDPFNTDDDDIWVLKCPSEINIQDFKGANLVLDGKSKIKIAGQTYDGTIDETDCKLPIVTYSKNKVFLKNLSVLKTITFRKRIPVPHIQDDTVVTHNHTSFIPLPDTKCRHPLFGTNYKKAIKISKSVGERLAESHLQPEVVTEELKIEQDIYKKKKKKHKKNKNRIEQEEVEASISVTEEDPIKKRKRKLRIKEENDIKPAKRIKLEQDPGAWESEKAIEQNLFNF